MGRTPHLAVMASALAAAAAVVPSSALARRGGRTSFRDKTSGIQIFLPTTWVRQWRSAFPGALVTFKHRTVDARLILSAKVRRAHLSTEELAKKNAAVLTKRGWLMGKVSSTRLGRLSAAMLIGTDPRSSVRLTQLYSIRGKFVYVVTFITPLSLSARLRPDLLFVQKSARFAR